MHTRYFSLLLLLLVKLKRAFPMHFPTPYMENVTIFLKAGHA